MVIFALFCWAESYESYEECLEVAKEDIKKMKRLNISSYQENKIKEVFKDVCSEMKKIEEEYENKRNIIEKEAKDKALNILDNLQKKKFDDYLKESTFFETDEEED